MNSKHIQILSDAEKDLDEGVFSILNRDYLGVRKLICALIFFTLQFCP